MKPTEEASVDNIPIPPITSSKRKLADQQQPRAASLKPSRSSLPSSGKDQAGATPKRLKTSHSSSNILQHSFPNMSKLAGKRPELVNLTRPSNFQPQAGAKRLVIKNLRTSSRADLVDFYARTWQELENALSSVFRNEDPAVPLETLFRGVEATCRNGKSGQLFEMLRDRCRIHLEKTILPMVEKEGSAPNELMLRTVWKYWSKWNDQSTLIRSIFSYLDRSYLLITKDALQLEDLAISQFRHIFFQKDKAKKGRSIGEQVVAGMCNLVEMDRTGQRNLFEPALLRDSIAMMHIFGIYGKSYEPEFLRISTKYFDKFAHDTSNSRMADYIAACDSLLAKEALRCDTFNFDSTTKRMLLDLAHDRLISQRTEILLSSSGLSELIVSNSIGSLKTHYYLLALADIQSMLKDPWERHIKAMGASIVMDKTNNGDDMVIRLLILKRSLDIIIRDSFNQDDRFTFTLRQAFAKFINDPENTRVWDPNGASKVGEMIAKYIDLLLRGGLKAVPRELLFDAKDRDAAEKQGQASSGDEDAELDRQLEQGLELFRFIHGKDVFEAFYKKDLARRLLMARSASQDAERSMLGKFRNECGFSFTHNLEQMFKDQELARDEMIAYKQSLSNTSKTTMDLQVSVLSSAAWPAYPKVEVNLPEEVARHIEKYDRHYKNKHSGRRLEWKHALAHSVVKATFNKGTKELLVSAFQAIVLVLFNDIEAGGNLSYTDIAKATGLIDAELKRTLQSLACAKFRILTKHPKGREIDPTNTFTVNLGFTDPKYRIKINQIQLKETKEENKETHARVLQDRQYETQAAIVRIMKSRKQMGHQSLVAEVIEQTRKRGMVELKDIKANIEKLIEKEYLEREGGDYVYLA